jgi:hypothetical protein
MARRFVIVNYLAVWSVVCVVLLVASSSNFLHFYPSSSRGGAKHKSHNLTSTRTLTVNGTGEATSGNGHGNISFEENTTAVQVELVVGKHTTSTTSAAEANAAAAFVASTAVDAKSAEVKSAGDENITSVKGNSSVDNDAPFATSAVEANTAADPPKNCSASRAAADAIAAADATAIKAESSWPVIINALLIVAGGHHIDGWVVKGTEIVASALFEGLPNSISIHLIDARGAVVPCKAVQITNYGKRAKTVFALAACILLPHGVLASCAHVRF